MTLSAPFSFSPEIAARFDFVGFDPRGVGGSTPTKCDGDLYTARRSALPIEDEAGLTAQRAANRALADSRTALSGPLAAHLDSVSVAHDMDAIRRALGERRISYYGGSYGTLIGQMHAELYPHRIRAMVLDSNMDHSQGTWGMLKTRTLELEGAFGQFADWCERTTTCEFHGRDVRAVYRSLTARAEAGTLSLPNPTRPISADFLRSLTFRYMYDPADLSVLSWLPASMDGATTETETATSADLTKAANAAAAAAPVTFAYDLVVCQDFDLIGREATLLTYDGVGHVTYWLSPCMRKATDRYLVDLTTPAKGTHCPAVRPEK